MLGLSKRFLESQAFGPVMYLMIVMLLAPLAVLFQSRPARAQEPKDGKSLCYAFIRDGDIWTVCKRKRERIDIHGKALDFAVSADGSYFAAQENLEPSGIGRTRQLLVPLNPTLKEKDRQVDYPESLYSTCGTIVSFDYVNLRPFDLINTQPMGLPPYKFFRCSFDRQVTAGWTEEDEKERQSRARMDPGLSAQITLRVSR